MPIPSLLDTDLYKLTMQQAVLTHFPTEPAVYRFTNRTKDDLFSSSCVERFRNTVDEMANLRLTPDERTWLERTCPYLKPPYIEYLASFRFKPKTQVHIEFHPVPEGELPASLRGRGTSQGDGEKEEYGTLEIWTEGTWLETILWEVPLMASLCEAYFETVDTDWTYDGQKDLAYSKTMTMLRDTCVLSEFGTRRRRSFKTHDLVVEGVMAASRDYIRDVEKGEVKGGGKVVGTSNVYLAMKHGAMPSGTIAHEWFMGVAALRGYEHGSFLALDLWEEIYPFPLLLTLTDTFSSEVFYKDFSSDPARASRWRGLRQDSGDPFVFAPRAKQVYESMGLEYRDKVIVYSDGLSVDKALRLRRHCVEVGFIPMFGIGTNYTNDFKKSSSGGVEPSRALNVVIKLAEVGGKSCVKISDELTKNTGNKEEVKRVKQLLSLPL